jgi:adenine/guanine phosphoribosyltransferase-like PRPP-binding protein
MPPPKKSSRKQEKINIPHPIKNVSPQSKLPFGLLPVLTEEEPDWKVVLDKIRYKGHFVLGLIHTDSIYLPRNLFNTELAEIIIRRLARLIGNDLQEKKLDFNGFLAVGNAGYVAYELARQLRLCYQYPVVVHYTIRNPETGKFQLYQGTKINKKDRIIVVEDILLTGNSTQQVTKLTPNTIGVACLVDLVSQLFDFNYRHLYYLISRPKKINLYTPDICPMCRASQPLDNWRSLKQAG